MELEHISITELDQMMETSDMKQYGKVANALVQKKSKEAYEVLKKHIFSKDVYKRRYVLSVIFEYPEALELVDELEKALKTQNAYLFMTTTILSLMIKYHITLDASVVVEALTNSDMNDGWYYQVLGEFDKNEKNLEMILKLYRAKRKYTSIRIFMAEEIFKFVNEENYMQLYQLFEKDEQPHIRMVACKIANKMGRRDLLELFKDDKDGHVRKYVMRNIGV